MSKERDEALKAVAKESFEKIGRSNVFLPLWTKDFGEDPVCMMQIGMAVLLDKPFYVMLEKGQKLPKSIELIAKKVVEFEGEDGVKQATTELCMAAKKDLGE